MDMDRIPVLFSKIAAYFLSTLIDHLTTNKAIALRQGQEERSILFLLDQEIGSSRKKNAWYK